MCGADCYYSVESLTSDLTKRERYDILCAVFRLWPERYSSIAQSVEHAAVNRAVVGSSPTRGVTAPWSSGQDTALSRR